MEGKILAAPEGSFTKANLLLTLTLSSITIAKNLLLSMLNYQKAYGNIILSHR